MQDIQSITCICVKTCALVKSPSNCRAAKMLTTAFVRETTNEPHVLWKLEHVQSSRSILLSLYIFLGCDIIKKRQMRENNPITCDIRSFCVTQQVVSLIYNIHNTHTYNWFALIQWKTSRLNRFFLSLFVSFVLC